MTFLGTAAQKNQQARDSVIKTAFDPGVVAVHELAGLSFVIGKFKQHDKYWSYSATNLVD